MDDRKAFPLTGGGRGVHGPALLLALFISCGLHQATAQKPDRSLPPKIGPPPALHVGPVLHFKLSNGLPVLLLERHRVPLVQMNLLIHAGAAMDPPGKKGTANMTAALLTEGAGGRDALQLADAIDYLGASVSAAAGYHSLSIELHTPLANFDSALALMADVCLRPTFPAEELERARQEILTSLLQWRDEPRMIASVVMDKALYGDHHPYGTPIVGDETSLRGLRAGDPRQFYETYAHPNNAALIVVGDVDAPSILPKLERAFGSWGRREVPPLEISPVPQVHGRSVVLVDKPGAAQSEIRIGRIGAQRTTDDYDAIQVLNTILGGSFSSRLNQNLRETHGYTYGAGSQFDFRVMPGPFLAGAAVQTDVTGKALAEFMHELENILKPIDEAEVDRARKYAALGYPRDFETTVQVASQLEQMTVFHLPDDYFDTEIGRILAVTKADVERVARQYIDPGDIVIVVVGDREKIAGGIQALTLGPITYLSVDDALGSRLPESSGHSKP